MGDRNVLLVLCAALFMSLYQGECVQLINGGETFQVIGVDDYHSKCWVRRWPLLPHGSPVFEVSIKQIAHSEINEQLNESS